MRDLRIQSILLYTKVTETNKDNKGTEALNPKGLMQQAVRILKEEVPDLLVMTDDALDPYSGHGHDGIVRDDRIVNDESAELLAKMAVSHAEARADAVAPADRTDD